jgi:predicted enzyme related to lactoylglutathione lyase
MINGAHMILYSSDADADRAFLAELFGLGSVDAGGGWMIFELPPAEVAVHPTDGPPQHELYLMCDDIEADLAALKAKGVTVSDTINEERWGRVGAITLPSGAPLNIYQPLHPLLPGR